MGILGDTWRRMAAGDPTVWLGLPEPDRPPDVASLTEEQRRHLEDFFHKEHGRYPASEYEFETWLRHNW